ncbi:hypothetical protein CTAYLR_002535 [Chrysophaeum taylorii]|uniref:t-SNARE coiled-coil homology domain-containing protein n=1 Tax=Chrysophaeum taylorii TaxID=2483200 RepID=A0AAD7UF26_9STRA|nr:hypothetical protein CTAYLR_002535 [Chrysophaeum taylorii]
MSFGELGRRPSVGSGGARVAQERRRPNGHGGGINQQTSQIADWLRQFQHNLSLLERLGESLTHSSEELLRQIAAQQEVVEELSRTVVRALGEMAREIEALPRPEQARLRATRAKLKKDYERVASELTRVVAKIKRSQKAASTRPPPPVEAEEHRVGRAQFGRSDAPGDLDVMIGDERVQLQVAMQEEAINDAILREREDEIRNINQSVHKVNEIFKDLATLVDKQQEDVEQISEHIEKSHQHAEKGLDQVQKAAKLQPSCAIS